MKERRSRNLLTVTFATSPRDHLWTGEFLANHYFRKPSRLAEFMRLGEIIGTLTCDAAGATQPGS